MNKSLVLLTLSSLVLAACGPMNMGGNLNASRFNNSRALVSRQSVGQAAPSGTVIPGEFLVKFRPGVRSANSFSAFGGQTVRTLGRSGIQLVRMQPGVQAQSLSRNPAIEWIEPNRVISLPREQRQSGLQALAVPSFPNDPMFAKQYSHKVTQAQAGWQLSQGNQAPVTIAIVDTGVDITHPDLRDKVVPGHSSFPESEFGKDLNGHGTHCAGIAAASINNGIGVAGVAPAARIQPVKVLDDSGSGTNASVAEGIDWAAENGAQVISMSLGGPAPSRAIEEAVKKALAHNIVVVAATGNDGNADLSYPAAIPGVMAIGATDAQDKLASFSQFGPHVSVTAPGVNILSTFPLNTNDIGMTEYGSISGTSMATPYVAGLVALVRGTAPQLNALQVRQRIEQSSDDLGTKGFDNRFGHGRVNVAKALQGLVSAPGAQMSSMAFRR